MKGLFVELNSKFDEKENDKKIEMSLLKEQGAGVTV